MSIKYVLAALEAQIGSSSAKLVLISLADSADNETGKCWPTVRNLCARSELSERAVRDNIQKLEGMGILTIQRRMQDGVNLPNVYVLNIEKMHALKADKTYTPYDGVVQEMQGDGAGDAGGVVQEMQGDGAGDAGGVVQEMPTNLSLEPVIEPKILATLVDMVSAKNGRTDLIEAVQLYNETAKEAGWPLAQKLTKPRESGLKARLRDAGGLEGWHIAMDKAKASPFLRGETGSDRNWRPDLDFFLQAKSFTRLMEGGYDGRQGTAKTAQSNRVSPSEENILRAFAFAGEAADGRGYEDGPTILYDPDVGGPRKVGFGGGH